MFLKIKTVAEVLSRNHGTVEIISTECSSRIAKSRRGALSKI